MAEIFDPSAPGVNRQMLIDWMHINHPMTPLRPRIGMDKLVDKVRRAQPQFFPNLTSHVAAPVTLGTANEPMADTSRPKISAQLHISNTKPTTISTIETAQYHHPKIQTLHETLIKDSKPVPSLPSFVRKRAVAFDTGSEDGASVKQVKTGGITRAQEQCYTFQKKPSEIDKGPSHSTQSEISRTEAVKLEESKDTSITVPNLEPSMSSTVSSGPMKIKHKIRIPAKPELTRTNEVMDLIDFSDTDILDTGNLVIGKDISPISFDTSTKTATAVKNTTKSGVEVFLEERSREERNGRED
ncbi:uncharacterized protein MELLADRAFT_89719 [Melampsora larici-populina 98AG31]|uniref:Uncharacterized protein n=1 Tax=Melampsora larici-populina (strain 98AG31 / pathotype 3-4-7) TaxID=747676 RepID=F4RUD3_MELLP|nr:uncharacterized protein MELLADRAFT_89719 [Melampsora larici-populina 98AG31]EGG04018.1 hypothetical protein MELLADRAFT_89719 [Melampsora larici-populina 98AG31]